VTRLTHIIVWIFVLPIWANSRNTVTVEDEISTKGTKFTFFRSGSKIREHLAWTDIYALFESRNY
jgi:hypothetical protein